MALYFSPVANDQIFDANGDPLVGGQIETYLAQSSTPAATYTSLSGGTPQSNPIILNSRGWPTLGSIWLTGGIAYKFIIKDALGSTLRTIDDIVGIGDTSVSLSEWVESGLVPTYITGTSFSVPGDQTQILQVGRRLRTTNTSGFVFSTISNSVFAAGITTVTLTNDSTALDAGLSQVAYALLAADPLSVPNLPASKLTGVLAVANGGTGQTTAPGIQSILPINQVRIDVASSATVDLTALSPGNDHINITGTTTINAFTVAAGRLIFARFNAVLTLTNSAGLVTQTGANLVTGAGDTCILRATAANTIEVLAYTRAVPFALGSAVSATGTSIDFTGIPAWARRVTVMLNGVRTNGTSIPIVQIGDSGGIETSSYVGAVGSVSSVFAGGNFSSGFLLAPNNAATHVYLGTVVLTLIDAANTWMESGNLGQSDQQRVNASGGSKTLSATLDRVRLTTVGGTDVFNAGTVNVTWE